MHPVDTLVTVHLYQLMLSTIVVEQENGLFEKDVQAFLYRLSPIVGTLVQLTSIQITHTRHFGRVSVNVINVLVGPADIPARKPLEQFLLWNFQVDREIDMLSESL